MCLYSIETRQFVAVTLCENVVFGFFIFCAQKRMSNNNQTPTLSAASALERLRRYPIIINVYDLNEINDYTYNFGLGIFHSGVHVHNKEWSFGGHEFPTSGCFYCEPKAVPPPAKFRISQCVGFTTKSEREVERIVRVLGAEEFFR